MWSISLCTNYNTQENINALAAVLQQVWPY